MHVEHNLLINGLDLKVSMAFTANWHVVVHLIQSLFAFNMIMQ